MTTVPDKTPPPPQTSFFEIVRTDAGWHLRLVGANSEIVMASEVYDGPDGHRSAERAMGIARGAVPKVGWVDERSPRRDDGAGEVVER